jgi:hypothetical protein
MFLLISMDRLCKITYFIAFSRMILNFVEKQRSHYFFKWAVEKSVL